MDRVSPIPTQELQYVPTGSSRDTEGPRVDTVSLLRWFGDTRTRLMGPSIVDLEWLSVHCDYVLAERYDMRFMK